MFQGITWGKAFLVAAENKAALPYLSTRECHLGGYRVYTVNFHPKPSYNPTDDDAKKDALLYIASPDNKHWLGAAPLPEIARHILESKGPSGSNVEYLIKLAEFMREEVPEALDDHLFSLERLVKKFACDMKICLRSLMGEVSLRDDEEQRDEKQSSSFQYAARVSEKKLRCVNM